MNYIENIFICLAAPLLIATLCMRGRGRRMMLFLLAGTTVCLLSSYINTFIAAVTGLDMAMASIEIAPMIEEVMKFMPVLFYLLVYEPTKEDIVDSVLMTAVGFATFENACYLTGYGAADILHLMIRGFGAGAMHVVCGFLVALGILYLWDRVWLQLSGTAGLLAIAMTYHGIYNILVSQTGVAAAVGYLIPLLTLALTLLFRHDYIPEVQKRT
ncbi:MAG: PrsW family intramembrane metalloprotease [Clostridia bacterium]|nr:PrsW family intramembrane metalloprotease [Clostridia bacterium]